MNDNRCSIPFTGYSQIQLNNNMISPCCKVRSSPILGDSLITNDMRLIRESIKNNIRHPLCSECWDVEDRGGPSFRIRNSTHFKNSINWDSIGTDIPISKAILIFSNKCQMMCAYCSPGASSMWEQAKGIIPIIPTISNSEIIDNILLNNLFTDISISGGEPLLDDRCINFLMNLEFNPKRSLSLVTNLSYGPVVFKKLQAIIERHPNISIGSSIDAIGENLSRKYLNWELWNSNFVNLAEDLQFRRTKYLNSSLFTKTTVGLLNYKDLQKVIEYVLEFRINGKHGIGFDLNPLSTETPTSLSTGIVDKTVQIVLDSKYAKLLTPKEKMLIETTNNLIRESIYDKDLEELTLEHIRKYVN